MVRREPGPIGGEGCVARFAANLSRPAGNVTVRVLSYNIHKGIGGRDRRYSLERIIEVIEQANPDFICLQEVDRHVRRTRYHDQPNLLSRYFNAQGSLYQMNVHLKTGGYGNLLLSRWPILEKHQVSLRLNWRKPRGAQMAIVETPEGPLHLVNWHLGLAEGERHWQVDHLLKHSLFCAQNHLPTLIVGDFNDWRNKLAKARFLPMDFHCATAPASRFRSFPAWLAMGALDKAFYRGPLNIKHAQIWKTPASRIASDHLPLVIDFHLKDAVRAVEEIVSTEATQASD